MSPAQIADIFRIICIVASALTCFSVVGYFTFSKIADKEKTARIDQLASANHSMAAQVAEYEVKWRLKEQQLLEIKKVPVATPHESRVTLQELAEGERIISEEETLLLLGPLPPPELLVKQAQVIATRDRSEKITAERYNELVTALRTVPRSDVEFLFNDSDPEAATLARQLSSALAEAGFRKREMPPLGKKYEWKPPVSGVRVAIAEGRPVPPMVPPFTEVLKRSGIQVDGVVNPNVPKTEKPIVWIIIGTNPAAG